MATRRPHKEGDLDMVEIFGRIESNAVRNGNQVTVFAIPAFSERLARRRAQANANLKDLADPQIDNIEVVGQGDIPGQSIYNVTILSQRV